VLAAVAVGAGFEAWSDNLRFFSRIGFGRDGFSGFDGSRLSDGLFWFCCGRLRWLVDLRRLYWSGFCQQKSLRCVSFTYFSTTGSGAFFGGGAGAANMLAQLFFTPSGMMLEVVLAATWAVEAVAGADVSQLSSVDLALSLDAVSAEFVVSQGVDSVLAVVESMFSLRDPLV